ncbi:ead/Ea22-like family protein [Enterobacter hormaechei]|uniref:ead/Ea22-like family protein n=1 Tax=Enterobacter hormaechei TaxID=158836 RepID=UPI000F82FE70|nr:ead/Ea22-like family protein [Enterobacter hormaechei]MDV1811143.1 ead/Ea22-like family protein [Enterobacter hormaechei]MDV1903687.1 ead/Ea22-like family protein [Enterobacter hormaechei]RTN05639.1 ead/Ea22-like family protein [Enterobacter hormaechei]
MSNIDKRTLRTKARSASAGEWIKESGDGWEAISSSDDQANGNFIIAHFEGQDAKANREFMQAANPDVVLALLDELEAAEKRIAELEAREVMPVAWMRNANVTSFMSRFTTNENYAVEQWGDDAVALYSIPVPFIPVCFTDERNLMHINERGRETSLIWSEQNSDSGDIQLFRIAAATAKGE